MTKPQPFALVAEFPDADSLLQAARRTYEAGYRVVDAYTPYPVHGLAEAIGQRHSWVSLIVLAGGVVGAAAGYLLQLYAVWDYPINVGGRPLHSWPAFIPITFEMSVLTAVLAGIAGMLILNGLPRFRHPMFDLAAFARATQDRFFLAISAADGQFDPQATRDFLAGLGPEEVHHVTA